MKIAAVTTVGPREFVGFCENAEDYAAALESGLEVFGFTSGDFSLIDILAALVKRMDSPRVVLATWTAAKAEIGHVFEFLDSDRISGARWVVDRSFQARQPELCAYLRRKFGDDAIRVQRVHCKFALLEDESRAVTLQTSANLNRNLRIENVAVSSCPVLYQAYSELAREIFATQMPGVGFETPAAVTQSFKAVTNRRKKSKTIASPWAN